MSSERISALRGDSRRRLSFATLIGIGVPLIIKWNYRRTRSGVAGRRSVPHLHMMRSKIT